MREIDDITTEDGKILDEYSKLNFCLREIFSREKLRNSSAHEQISFVDKFVAFCKDFSQWKSGSFSKKEGKDCTS